MPTKVQITVELPDFVSDENGIDMNAYVKNRINTSWNLFKIEKVN